MITPQDETEAKFLQLSQAARDSILLDAAYLTAGRLAGRAIRPSDRATLSIAEEIIRQRWGGYDAWRQFINGLSM